MAQSDKNIVIIPNIGQTADPKIVFSGADASTAAQNITLQVYPSNNGTLSFEGSAGQLFSITNSLSGTIFSVNDVSGIPSIEVQDTGDINLARFSGNVTIGSNVVISATSISATVPIVANSFTVADSDDSFISDSTISSWTTTSTFSVSAQETEPRDIIFSSDGTKMYILGNTGNDVNQYTLSTPWSISTATYLQVFSVATQEPSPYGLFFSTDGTNMYIVGSTSPDNVYRYTLSTAWNISTASYVSAFSVTAKDTDPQAVAFSSDGTKMYITGTSSDSVHQYNLSSAWDITTAVFSTTLSVSAYSTAPQGLDFSSDGTKMYIIGSTYNRLIEYTLSTPWSISTATFSGTVNCVLLGSDITIGCSGVFVQTEQNKAYICDFNSDKVFELATNIAATRFNGSKLLIDSDSHFQQDLVVYKNLHSNENVYARNGLYSYNYGYVAGTLDVRGAVDLADNDILRLGTGDDIEIYHNGTHNFVDINNGDLIIRDDGTVGDPTRFTFARTTGNLTAGGDMSAVNFNSTSDEREKTNISTIENALEKTLLLRGVEFDWKNTQKHAIGVIAQEVEKIVPEVVETLEDKKTVSYGNIVGLLIEAIKEQQAQINNLKEQIERLNG